MMDSDVIGFMVVPLILFMIFVAPIWLILHYRSKKQVSQGLTAEEHTTLRELTVKADVMADRIQTLEAILDEEAPDWRRKA
ncbi:envelope stress response membrane protein PspB [Alteromonas sediminis]|uniref:Envelope stress response membrane protein PspB n=1 Tax=Alteromonas sediminis TaxID=2259342 RepID=A0A3N5Y934_9ALTE|nr:envelope stress response membrane protein PspB [Alteromonas sediminis]RPJ65045.1 envelope stress response membrane protein PspB [Alteromonas sediminis]